MQSISESGVILAGAYIKRKHYTLLIYGVPVDFQIIRQRSFYDPSGAQLVLEYKISVVDIFKKVVD